MEWTARIKLILYTALVALYLLNIFLESDNINYINGLIAVGCIMISFKGANRLFQVMCSLFLLAGILLYANSDLSWTQLPTYMTSTVLLLALLYMLPFINNVIKVGRYDQQLSKLLKVRASHLGQLYYRTSLVSYILCIFLFFAAIPLVYDVLRKNLKDAHHALQNKFASQSVLRGFAMATVWSPIEVFIALTVAITGVSYLAMLPWLLLFSVTILLLDWLRGLRYREWKLTQHADRMPMDQTIIIKITRLISALFIFILLITVVHHVANIEFFTAVTLAIIPFSLLWSMCIKRFKAYLRFNRLAWKKRTLSLQNFMLLFLSLGFINSMVEESNVLEIVQDPFMQLAQTPVILFVLIQISSLLLPLVGFHPLVTIGLLGVMVQPLLTEINPLSIAIVLLTANLATDASGTYNSTVAIMSQLLKVNPYRITWWNLRFSLVYGSLGVLLAVLLL